MTTATSKVFGTAELLEAILLQLPPRDLLLAQRMNKAFKATIDSSNHIQRKLFFKPNEVRQGDETGMVTINPFLPRIIRLMDRARITPCFEPMESEVEIHHRGNDLRDRAMIDEISGRVYRRHANGHIEIRLEPYAERFLMPSGSWREMLASDPPRFKFIVYTDPTLPYATTPTSMGDLVDSAFYHILLTG